MVKIIIMIVIFTNNFSTGSFHAKTAKVGRAKKIDLAEILYACRKAYDWVKYKIL